MVDAEEEEEVEEEEEEKAGLEENCERSFLRGGQIKRL